MKRIFLILWWVLGLAEALGAAPATVMAPTAITIWPFDSHSLSKAATSDDQVLLQELVPDLLGAELALSPRLKLVERQRLGDLLNEQKLAASALADEATRLQLGRLVGARWMVFGSFLRIADAWQLDVRVVEVESSRIVATSSESGQGRDYVPAIHRIAAQLRQVLP